MKNLLNIKIVLISSLMITGPILSLYRAQQFRAQQLQKPMQQPTSEIELQISDESNLSPEQKEKLLTKHKKTQKQLLLSKIATQKKILEKENTFEGHSAPITSLVISENGNIIASSCEGNINNLIVWDRKNKKKLREISLDAIIDEIFLSHDGNILIVSCYKNNDSNNIALYLFNTKSKDDGRLLPIEKYRATTVCCLSALEFNFDDRYMVYQVYNKNIDGYHTYVFDTVANKSMQSFRSKTFLSFVFHPTKAEIAIAFSDRVSTYNLNPFKKIQDLYFPTPIESGRYQELVYSVEGKKIIFCNENDSTFIWDEKNGLFDANPIHNTKIRRPRGTLDNKGKNFIEPVMSTQGPIIVFYDVITNEKKYEIPTKTFIDFLSFSSNNEFITGIDDKNIIVVQANTGKQMLAIPTEKPAEGVILPNIEFSKDNAKISVKNNVENQEFFSIYDIKENRKLYHNTDQDGLYSTDKNFNSVVFIDKKNPKNFILKDLSTKIFNVLVKPRKTIFKPITIVHPIEQEPILTKPTKLLESNIKKQIVVPSQPIIHPAFEINEPLIQKSIPQQPAVKTWWQWLTGQ